MDHNDREQFWKTLCSLPGNDIVAEREQLFKSIKYPKLLFRYRPVSTKSLEALRTNILEFKSKRKDELNAFRAKIRELEINIYNADSPELIRHYETQFIEEWQQCSQDYYKALKDSKLAFFLSSLVSLVGIPFVGQQLSTYIGQDVTPLVQTGAQLLKIGIGYFDYRNKISPAKADGGFSYIIKANRDGIIHI